jgi:hypothetical protein
MMESVYKILETQNIENQSDFTELDVNTHFTVENEPYMDLDIEKYLDDQLSVGHFYSQRGDQMSDPEMRFDVSEYDTAWIPVEFRSDGVPQMYERNENGLGPGVTEFVRTWDDQLENQGYVAAARNGQLR